MTSNDCASRDALARRVSAGLCLALLIGLAWGLYRWTFGFEVWTFEGRRQVELQHGLLRARPVALLTTDGSAPLLWRAAAADADAAPAAYLVDFIYTRCRSICRALGSEYQQMQRELAAAPADGAAADKVKLVSISFDINNDDPAQLARHAAEQGADPSRWIFAVPATRHDADGLLGSLGVVVVPDGGGDFVHNGSIHLLDERGRLRGLYAAEQWPQALAAARRLADRPGQARP